MDWSDALVPEPVLDDEVRALRALHAGHVRLASHRRTTALVGVTGVLLGVGTWALLPASSPDTSVVVACAGSAGQPVGTAHAGGVSLAVHNPTATLQRVSAGTATALALPGDTTVTLPLSAGDVSVRCGTGPAVRLRVTGSAGCPASPNRPDVVESGRLADLTLAHLGAVPPGAVVDTGSGLRRVVRVRTGDRVVAEAVWHALPGDADWQLESFARCS